MYVLLGKARKVRQNEKNSFNSGFAIVDWNWIVSDSEISTDQGGFQACVDYYKRDIDRTLLRENLKLTVEERWEKYVRTAEMVEELRRAGEEMRRKQASR